MEKLIIEGGKKLYGQVSVSGAKNVAMKVVLTGLLTSQKIKVYNVPLITSVFGTADLVKHLGVKVEIGDDHSMEIKGNGLKNYSLPLDMGGLYRTATMLIGPLLQRFGKAVVPNPGGCRLGQRPVDWHIEGLKKMGAKINYEDGYFIAEAEKLKGVTFKFPKNSHTGTETLILAAVKAEGDTLIENASLEPEVNDLINLLKLMGGNVTRLKGRRILIKGVKKLNGADFKIMPDRNEVVTFAIGAIASGGKVEIKGARSVDLKSFLAHLYRINAEYRIIDENRIIFAGKNRLAPSRVKTQVHPGFMTDWQAPWSLLMTQAQGNSLVHETIFEDRFNYVPELIKMGAKIDSFNPAVKDPEKLYNFNWNQNRKSAQGIRIFAPTSLHEAVLEVSDLRAGATLVLAAAIAEGKSIIHGIHHIDRGYEKIEGRLNNLGVSVKRITD